VGLVERALGIVSGKQPLVEGRAHGWQSVYRRD